MKPLDEEIIFHLSDGLTTKEISTLLHKSKFHIDYRLKRLRKKYGAKNTTELLSKIAKNSNSET